MANEMINTSSLTNLKDWATDTSDILVDQFIQAVDVNGSFRLFTGLNNDTVFTTVNRPSLVLGHAKDCGSSQGSTTTTTTGEITFSPTRVGFDMKVCVQDLKGIFRSGRATGNSELSFEDNALSGYLKDLYAQQLPNELARLAWFGDTDAATTTASPTPGVFTSSDYIEFYDKIDGAWKLLFSYFAETANAGRLTEITQNSETTQALQTLTATEAYDYIKAVYNSRSLKMIAEEANGNLQFHVTSGIYDLFIQKLAEKDVNDAFAMLQMGNNGPTFLGIPIYRDLGWTRAILENMTDANGVGYLPNRILLFNPDNIGVGFREDSDSMELKSVYDEVEEVTYIRSAISMDVKLLNGDFAAAY
jgi:hypothetical protein